MFRSTRRLEELRDSQMRHEVSRARGDTVTQEPAESRLTTPVAASDDPRLPKPNRVGDFEQIHLRLRREDARLLRALAAQREQTLSAAVRYLLRPFRAGLSTQVRGKTSASSASSRVNE